MDEKKFSVYKKKGTCALCKSKYLEETNKMLQDGVSQRDVINWLASQTPPFKFSGASMCRHKNYHFTKIEVIEPIVEDDEEPDISKDQLIAMTDFLDLIINKVNSKIKNNQLKPTITEAIKAADIKSKIKEGSKVEKELLKFIVDISNGHNNQANI